MKKRSGNLDLMKFLFSLMIIFFHGKNLATTESYLFPGGSIAVEFFFVVSGVLMARAACTYQMQDNLGKDTFVFMKHKISGLMPNYYIAFVIAFVVLHRNVRSLSVIFRDLVSSVWELLLVINTGLRPSRSVCNGPVWYMSAMLLAMCIIWPIMRKYKNTFFYVIAPISALFLMGITFQNWTSFGGQSIWRGYMSKGTIRAFMGLLLGCVCYKIAEYLKQQKFTILSRILFSIVEFVGYVSIFVVSFIAGRGQMDWFELIVLAICITITYSNISIWSDWFSHPFFNWLGVFSYSLYLGHGYWSNCMVDLFPTLNYWSRIPYYLLISFATGLFIHYSSLGLRRIWKSKGPQMKKLFVND
ncbi:MAG: acyltransferase family protein [Lachnospiraceae bacterium]|nr:acyltransferase family protein [Lachnospiraceae bacterium]MDY3818222.1 acyltransferase family protein [Lachnospiraceae bacterium]